MAKDRILIVDDEANIVSSLKGILTDEGHEISVAQNGLDALKMIESDPPDLVLLDIWLPGMDGIEVLKTVKTYHPEVEVLIMSGHGTIDTAVKATKLGAYDFIEKPFSLDHLTQSVDNVLKLKKTKSPSKEGDIQKKLEILLRLEMMEDVKKSIKAASRHRRPVLILGEEGTCKEFIAQAIHRQSRKNSCPFLKVNCAVRDKESIQARLFAPAGKGGRSKKSLESQEKVIYLSNIDALSRELQKQLARALRNEPSRKNSPGGGFLPTRVFASSSKDLETLAEEGRFDPALLETFRETTLKVPPLREYVSNLPFLVRSYLKDTTGRDVHTPHKIDDEALNILCLYDWPGNLKELRSVLDKILITNPWRDRITVQDLPPEIRGSGETFGPTKIEGFDSLQEAEQMWEREFIIHHLKKHNWDLEKTCESLKTGKKSFREKLKRHSITLPQTNGQDSASSPLLQRTLKRSVVLCGSGLHSGINTGLILQPLPPGSGIIFGDISSGQMIPAQLDNVQSTEYATCLKKGLASVATIEHIMAVLHMYRISNLLIKIGDEAPVMDGSAKDFCELIEDGEFEEQNEFYNEIVIDKTYTFGPPKNGGPCISIEPCETFKVSYHMEYPEPIGVQDYTFEFKGEDSFKEEIAPARTFGFLEDVAQLTKMGFAGGGKLDNFILLGDKKVLNTKLRFQDEFVRHKILDIIGDFYLFGKPIRGFIKAHKSGHTQNIGLLNEIRAGLTPG